MNRETKNEILSHAKKHVDYVCELIKKRLGVLESKISKKAFEEIRKSPPDERLALIKIFEYNKIRVDELAQLYPSPYFVRCDVLFDDHDKTVSWYFSKFQLSDECIYSWVSPAAIIRFESPGIIAYKKPDGTLRTGKLIRKDQYMIVGGRIIFLSTESHDTQRELIHQEHFTNKKTDFTLPEIVAQMEKMQDHVIRAHHNGPFVISGPAGSGKTTLALHRVAYLVQSPDTTMLYPSESIVVFVQDIRTKEYFSRLLPELGITDVSIITFAEWAMRVLEIDNSAYVYRYGETESEKDFYEYSKLRALKKARFLVSSGQTYTTLEAIYSDFFSDEQRRLFSDQKKDNVLDRFDLTILLSVYQQKNKTLDEKKQYFEENSKGVLKRKVGKKPIKYSLIVVDEFQNYLPEQLLLLKTVVDVNTQSIVYVGDMAQQTQLGTVTQWNEINESVASDRQVVLQKVYRNTESILNYIKLLGYEITIPIGIRKGPSVVEKVVNSRKEEIEYIKNIINNSNNASVGVLAKEESYLQTFKEMSSKYSNVHVFTMSEAQGVEFEIVIIVGITKNLFSVKYHDSNLDDLIREKKKVNKDLLYVALTRAISELHVLGESLLSDAHLSATR